MMNSPKFAILSITIISFSLLAGCVELINKSPSGSKSVGEQTINLSSFEPFGQSYELNRIQAILHTDDLLWLGTPDGLYTFSYPSMEMEIPDGAPYLKGESIIGLLSDSKGTIYANSQKTGLHALPKGDLEFFSTGSSRIRAMILNPKGDAVYCATSHGVDIFENNAWRNIKIKSDSKFASQANDVTSIAVDNKGQYWLGTTFGVYRMKSENKFDFLFGDYQIVQSNMIIDERGNSPLSGNLLYSITYSPQTNRLLLNSNGGLSIINSPENYKNKNTWVSYTGDHTTSRMINGQIESIPVKGNSPLPNNFIKLSIEIGDSLFIGSDEGLAKFDRKTNLWSLYNIDNQLSGDQVLSLYSLEQSGEHLLMVGTSGGLSILKINSSRTKEES
ncbi:MAG: two-component regulator propeller domain-containing protein [bacterium]|nr:two-component regulator propeller domain-containing protein [bacterium]